MPTPAARSSRTPAQAMLMCAAAWAVPGLGHLLLGRTSKAIVFFATLTLMFVTGLWLEGRLFPFDLSQPLVALAALADVGIGVPYLVAKLLGAGEGRVIAVTFEYGNTFMIVAGLLNALVVIDVFDIAKGRK
jgi:hypothetical protein